MQHDNVALTSLRRHFDFLESIFASLVCNCTLVAGRIMLKLRLRKADDTRSFIAMNAMELKMIL